MAIQIEQHITFTYGKKFRDRGPEAPEQSGVHEWRHQPWRKQGERWGTRGGTRRAEWNAFYQAKGKGKSNGKGKHKNDSKGKGKGKDKEKGKDKS